MLVRLRMSAKKIKRAVLEMDDDTLSEDDLAALSRLLPSVEEAERLKAFEGEVDKLAKPDQYFREVGRLILT
jgi:diaphanous 1